MARQWLCATRNVLQKSNFEQIVRNTLKRNDKIVCQKNDGWSGGSMWSIGLWEVFVLS